jgi:hypothetical protein
MLAGTGGYRAALADHPYQPNAIKKGKHIREAHELPIVRDAENKAQIPPTVMPQGVTIAHAPAPELTCSPWREMCLPSFVSIAISTGAPAGAMATAVPWRAWQIGNKAPANRKALTVDKECGTWDCKHVPIQEIRRVCALTPTMCSS